MDSDSATFLDRLLDSLQALLAYLPSMFGAAAVITVGYVLAKLAQRGVGQVLRRMHLNDVLKRGGIPAHDHTGQPVNPTRVVANLVFWLVLFTAMLVAADALGIDYLGQVFTELLSYVPSVIAAVVIVILGIVLGDFVSALIARDSLQRLRPQSQLGLLTRLDRESSGVGFHTMYGVHGIDEDPQLHPFAVRANFGKACSANADCGGPGNLCVRATSSSPKRCTAACTADAGCGDGYACKAVASTSTSTIYGRACARR